MRDYALIIGVIACAAITLRNPVFGLLTYICFTLTNPASMTWGIGHSFPLGAVIAVATIVGFIFWGEAKRVPHQSEFWLMIGVWLAFGWSTIFSTYPELALPHLEHVSKIFLMVLLSIFLINSVERIHILIRVIAFSLGAYALGGGIFALTTGFQFIVYGPEDTFLESNNAIGMAFAMNAPMLFYLRRIEERPWLRWLLMTMFVSTYPAVLATFSRGAWLGLGVASMLLVWKMRRRMLMMLLLGAVLSLVLPVMTAFTPERVANRMNDLKNYDKEHSAQSRLWTWKFCANVGLANPLYGGGFDFYTEEMYLKYLPEYLEEWSTVVHSCHSMWFTILGEHGLPGLAIWLSLLGTSLKSLRRLRIHARVRNDLHWAIPYSQMMEIALVCYAVTGTFLDTAYFDLYYQLVAVIIMLKQQVQFRVNEQVESSAAALFTDAAHGSTQLSFSGPEPESRFQPGIQ